MKTTALSLSLFLLATLSLAAQSKSEHHPITQETFALTLEVGQNQSLQLLSFTSAKGKRLTAEITHPGDLSLKQLKAGMSIAGIFQFESFASEGGLGTTRTFPGRGKGELREIKIRGKGEREVKSSLKKVQGMVVRVK